MAISSTVDQLFAQALQFHQAGQLPHALQGYEQVLRLAPRHFDALHNTGIAAFQSGAFDTAASFFRSALTVDPEHATAHNNLGNALRELQLMEEALRSYDRALALDAADANTHFNRAVTLQSLLRIDEALQGYEQALTLAPGDDQAWSNRAALLAQARQYEQALVHAEQALALNPHNLDAHHQRGNILHALGQDDEAERSYRQVLALLPEFAEAHYSLGRLLQARGRQAEALQALEQALRLQPQLLQAHWQRAAVLRQLGQPDAAQQADAAALTLQTRLVAAYRQRGQELEQLRHYESAAALYAAALELDADNADLRRLHADALANTRQHEQVLASLRRALALKMERGAHRQAPEQSPYADLDQQVEQARIAFEKLTRLAPDNPLAHVNLGTVLQGLGLRDQAMASFERALAIAPNSPLANWNSALLLLARGDYERGWQRYEARWKVGQLALTPYAGRYRQPQWTGNEPLQGKTLLLHAEQGLGDTIQFCRYATLARQRGARVILEVQEALAQLMTSMADADQVIVKGGALPAYDFHLPMLSLPLAFGTRVDSIPAAGAYLRSDAAKRAQWQQLLGPKSSARIGVVWSGRAAHGNDHNRSLPLATLAPVFAQSCEFICLQQEVRPEDQALLDTLPVRQVSHLLRDFSDTAALCDLMDVVITVDTSVAHLAGALGKPVWIMLPTPFEWRWFEHGAGSPWYPSATLLRQQQIGDWAPVVAAVQAGLRALA
ncbi:tetratricopeptide repeat protein [Duganella callida]|uniref:Tetratricopeptide repeat protein n=1 Tax=Duganella callida TaxID=2561932 RepID=A0A4Y9SDF1_9BURK|nr:tetratricopeptide repeat protein [Duganella callida]TFW18560.1 tetratricopeptide repeat protein [Duganella callida]